MINIHYARLSRVSIPAKLCNSYHYHFNDTFTNLILDICHSKRSQMKMFLTAKVYTSSSATTLMLSLYPCDIVNHLKFDLKIHIEYLYM